jgi:hypothetical protein
MRALACALLVLGTTAFADGSELDAVRAALGVLVGKEPVQASLAVTRWERVTGEKTPQEGSAGATFFVAASKTGVTVSCSEALLAPRPTPKKKDGPPDVLGSIVAGVDLHQASRWLSHAAPLLKQLETAELVEDKEATLDGKPVRALKLKLKTEHQAESGAEATTERAMTLWVDAEHLPLACESVANASGGFLVVRFESHQKSERKYAKAGDRLLLVEETEESSTSSMGHTFQNKQTARLTVK